MGGGVIGKVLNPIKAYRDHKEKKAKREVERKQKEYEAQQKRTQANSDQAERKQRNDNLADISGLQDAGDGGGMPDTTLAGLGEGGVSYDLRKRKLLGGAS